MTPQRYANIDGLRAIAALGVMIEHLFGDLLRQTPPAAGPMNAVGDALVHSVSLGRFGVALFFLISGFVVPFSIGGERPLAHFAISRMFRLYPAFWLALAVLATVAWFAGEPPGMKTVLANMTMAPVLFSQPWLSPIHWTLFIELLFYVLVAGLFAVGRLRNVGALSALGVALIAATVLPVLLRVHGVMNLPVQYLGMHLCCLLLGLLLRLWLVERLPGAGMAVLALALAQFAALLSVSDFSLARGDNFIMEGRTPILTAYVLAFVVFLAAVRPSAFAGAGADRADQLLDVSLPRHGERSGLPAAASDRADHRYCRDADLRRAHIDGLFAGVPHGRAPDDDVRPHNSATARRQQPFVKRAALSVPADCRQPIARCATARNPPADCAARPRQNSLPAASWWRLRE
jgi:peptidoglycan/LPS O-acetylase OafA/YrhL